MISVSLNSRTRIGDQLLPRMTRMAELHQGSQTMAGVPIHLSFLDNTNWMAENAFQAAALGAKGIDINFGCPAKNGE